LKLNDHRFGKISIYKNVLYDNDFLVASKSIKIKSMNLFKEY